ncbi:hemoglobin [Pseudoxanthobacter soli DSM 19599]|uniref:Hemoglobin n=1 Tax=Pseudoxanthobacter soli DSM 19599 TaxID=1123029 RepID=A0A1M7ZF17_9HYPH|nr:group II truncated hemoglobin [Pseudoxanthobacter soli]SHO63477.1 hemoglobin [Pseudoxanthobacter soli DSM 19599]
MTSSADATLPEATTPYEMIGGDDAVRRLVARFYRLMDELPEAAACRAIHPESLADSEQKLYEFLSGWLGGPPLFVERRGAPMLRRRHLHAPIGPDERDGWMLCFRRALVETVEDEALRGFLLERIEALANHMQNRP